MKSKYKLILLAIISLGIFLRFYRLGSIPEGFFSDEAAVGYNAYSLIKTGKDEFGKPWPMFFTSFGEGKLSLYIYQAIPWVGLFGLNEFAVRFSGAFFASLTLLIWFFLLQEILSFSKINKKYYSSISLLSVFVLSIMPWHIHFSRGVFGQEMIFWILLGSWLLIKNNKNSSIWLAFISFSASLLIYHSAKVILPLFVPILLLVIWKKSKKSLNWLIKKNLLGVLFLVAIWVLVSFHPIGRARAITMSVFSRQSGVFAVLGERLLEERYFSRPILYSKFLHNKVESYGRGIIGRYLSHFNPNFLFISGDQLRPRYRIPGVAQMNFLFLPFAIIGFYLLFKEKLYLILAMLLLSPLPAALTFETPSTVRALFMTIPLSAIIGLGLFTSFNWLKRENKKVLKFF